MRLFFLSSLTVFNSWRDGFLDACVAAVVEDVASDMV